MEYEFPVNRTILIFIHPCFALREDYGAAGSITNTIIHTPSFRCVLLYGFLVLMSLITICGNLLVIISIIYFRQLHTPTNYLVLSLAVADLLVGLFVFPLTMAFNDTLCGYNLINHFPCVIVNELNSLLTTCSTLHLCFISVDRYYAVCQPLTYRTKINDHVAVAMILVSWGFSLFLTLFSSMTFGGININGSLTFTSLELLFAFYLPVVVVLCVYVKILTVALRQARSIHNPTCHNTKSGAPVSKIKGKATKTLAIVMGVFLVCLSPGVILATFPFIWPRVLGLLTEGFNWLLLSNSMLNPFIYAFFYTWFRSSSRMIISGKIFQGDFANSRLF